MNEYLTCPEWGCDDIGRGRFSGFACLRQDKVIARGSEVLADVCSNCGYIIKLRVDRPHIFKP